MHQVSVRTQGPEFFDQSEQKSPNLVSSPPPAEDPSKTSVGIDSLVDKVRK